MTHRSTIGFLVLAGVLPSAPAQAPSPAGSVADSSRTSPKAQDEIKTYTVSSGTRILLSLKNEISTRLAMPGDPVYLDTVFPVVQNGVVVLPAGMYVKGTIESVQRRGKVKGRANLQMRITSMMFPNGAEIALSGSLDNASPSTGAKVVNAEGADEQSGNKGRDTQSITTSTLEGVGVGSLIGDGAEHLGGGVGIGAGTGAALGVLTTLFTRGDDVVFQPGTTLEIALNRPVIVQQSQLRGMPAYTGVVMPAVTAPQ
jgi:hypothetical protein